VGGELEPALGDVAERVQAAASRTERVKCELAPVTRSASASAPSTISGIRTTSTIQRRRPPVMTIAAQATPAGKSIAAPTSAPNLPEAKIAAKTESDDEEDRGGAPRREARREARSPAPMPPTISTASEASSSLPIPVEADAEARVRPSSESAESGERGSRRARRRRP